MRVMPPTITTPASRAMTTPETQGGTPKYSRVVSAALQVWNMLPPVKANSSKASAKAVPMILPARPPMALRATNMVPPCGFLGSLTSR